MSILPFAGIAALMVASLEALRRMVRGGESRWWPLSALLAALTAQFALAFVLDPIELPGLPLGVLPEVALGAACVLGLLVAFTYARTAAERDRAETLHWESMEMVRGLVDLREGLPENAALDKVLEPILDLARARFGTEIGFVTRIHGDRCELIAARCPHKFDLSRGSVLPLSDTFCERVFATQQTLAFSNAASGVWSEHPAKLALGFGRYLGAPVRVAGERFGTLGFAGSETASIPFSASQKDLASLLARWVGFEIDRAVANEVASSKFAPKALVPCAGELQANFDIASEAKIDAGPERNSEAAASPSGRSGSVSGGGLDVNAALEKMKSLLARCAGVEIELTLNLASNLRPVQAPAIAFRQLVLNIVRHAVASMPAGGELVLETGYVGPASPGAGPHAIGEPAPCGFVTLAVRNTAGDVDRGKLGSQFETALRAKDDDPTARSAGAIISLGEIERILRRGGGDLSLAVEPGLGTTYTVFLPEALAEIPARAETSAKGATRTAIASTAPREGAKAPTPKIQLSLLT